PEAEGVLAAVFTALEDKDARVRDVALFAVENLGPKAQLAVPTLVKLLDHKNRDIRSDAQNALARLSQRVQVFGPRSEEANLPRIQVPVTTLIPWLHDPDNEKFHLAIGLLGLHGAEAKAAVPDLIKVLRGKNAKRYDAAVQALGRIGPAAHAAVPDLLPRLDD